MAVVGELGSICGVFRNDLVWLELGRWLVCILKIGDWFEVRLELGLGNPVCL